MIKKDFKDNVEMEVINIVVKDKNGKIIEVDKDE
jgi:hypothetical protein